MLAYCGNRDLGAAFKTAAYRILIILSPAAIERNFSLKKIFFFKRLW